MLPAGPESTPGRRYPAPMRVTVLAFASLGQTLGWKRREVDVPEGTRADGLLAQLLAEAPEMEPHLARLAVAVDGEVGPRTAPLRDGGEVALLPPVSGG